MNRFINIIMKSCVFLIKVFHIPFLLIFSLWLLQILYFPHLSYKGISVKQSVPIPEYAKDKKMLQSIMKHKEPVSVGHFHVADEYVSRMIHKLDSNPPFCMMCHGTYPHTKEKKTRALTNLHTSIMACEVCHIRREAGDEDHFFTWVDLRTEKRSMKVKGGYGKYQSVIIPFRREKGDDKRLDRILGEKFPDYEEFTPELDEERKKKVHEHLSKKPVACLECHKQNGYLDFEKLGYPPHRATQLVSSEVSRMVEHYDTFYMPKMFRFK